MFSSTASNENNGGLKCGQYKVNKDMRRTECKTRSDGPEKKHAVCSSPAIVDDIKLGPFHDNLSDVIPSISVRVVES